MYRSIFAKQLLSSMLTLLVGFVILALMLSVFFSSYLRDQKLKFLEEQSKRVAAIYAQVFVYNDLGALPSHLSREVSAQLSNEFQSMQTYMNVHVIITDNNMNVVGYSNDIENIAGTKITDDSLIRVLEGGLVSTVGTLAGFFPSLEMTVGTPVIVRENVVAAAFVSAPMTDVDITMGALVKLLLIAFAICVAGSFVLAYFTSATISKPIRLIKNAAKEVAAGDFEKRLPVMGRDEVGSLAQSFNEMAQSLFTQEKQRRDFIANISHDLRSPLTSIRGFLQAILDGVIPPEKHNHYLGIVLEETERLTKLANDVMDISKIQNLDIELTMTPFNLSEQIRKTALAFEARLLEKNIAIDVILSDETDIVLADHEKISRVIYNLLDNAVKFTPNDGKVTIETTKQDDKIFVSIKDTGPGLTPEEEKRVFERFYKGDASRGQNKGSGLGLSIAREFIKAHGETISVKTEPGNGCVFEFSLNLAKVDSL